MAVTGGAAEEARVVVLGGSGEGGGCPCADVVDRLLPLSGGEERRANMLTMDGY